MKHVLRDLRIQHSVIPRLLIPSFQILRVLWPSFQLLQKLLLSAHFLTDLRLKMAIPNNLPQQHQKPIQKSLIIVFNLILKAILAQWHCVTIVILTMQLTHDHTSPAKAPIKMISVILWGFIDSVSFLASNSIPPLNVSWCYSNDLSAESVTELSDTCMSYYALLVSLYYTITP